MQVSLWENQFTCRTVQNTKITYVAAGKVYSQLAKAIRYNPKEIEELERFIKLTNGQIKYLEEEVKQHLEQVAVLRNKIVDLQYKLKLPARKLRAIKR